MDRISLSPSQHVERHRGTVQKWIVVAPFLLALFCVGVMIPGMEASWFLAIASICFILLFFADDSGLQVLLLANAIIRYAIVFLDHLYTGAILIEKDAARFVIQGTSLALDRASPFFSWRGEQSAYFYDLLVSRLFRVFGAHALVLQVTTIIAFLIFLVLAYQLGKALNLSPTGTLWALAIFSFLPSTVLFTSIGLREAWLLVLLSGFLLAALRLLGTAKLSVKNLIVIVFTSLLLMLMHKAFSLIIPFTLIILFIFLLFPRERTKQTMANRFFWIFVLLLIFSLVVLNTELQSNILRSFLQGELLKMVDEGRNAVLFRTNANTIYKVPIDASSNSTLLASLPIAYFYYMAAPFPWQIADIYDFYGFVDAWIGLIFVFLSVIALFKYSTLRTEILFLMIVFLLISGIHSVGTISFGTAIRHRLMSLWIVVIIGVSVFQSTQVLTRGRKVERHLI